MQSIMKEIALGVALYFGQGINFLFFFKSWAINNYLICKRGEMNNQHLLTLNRCCFFTLQKLLNFHLSSTMQNYLSNHQQLSLKLLYLFCSSCLDAKVC